MPDAEEFAEIAHASEATPPRTTGTLYDMTVTEAFAQLLQLIASVLGATALPEASAAVAITVALLAVATILVALTFGIVRTGQGTAPHPRRAIDRSTLPAQSHPDAAGHPRPRAPGAAPAV